MSLGQKAPRLVLSTFVLALLVPAAVACGGAEPPPASPKTPAPNPDEALLADKPAATPAGKPAAAPPSGEDVARGMKALDANDFAGARAAFEAALKKNAKTPDAAFYLGVALEKLGDKAGAEKRYKDALELRPDLDAAAVNLGALYIESNKLDEAATITKKALEKQPKNAPLLVNLGLALGGKGDAAGATKAFDDAVKAAPRDVMTRLVYAQSLRGWKRNDEAAEQLRQAAPAATDVATLASVGHEQRLVGAFADCNATLSKAIASQDVAELRTDRALCRVGLKDDAGALEDLNAAVKKEPSYGPAHFYLANRLAQAGKFADAVKEYEAYLKVAPKGEMVKQAEERLKVAREKAKKK